MATFSMCARLARSIFVSNWAVSRISVSNARSCPWRNLSSAAETQASTGSSGNGATKTDDIGENSKTEASKAEEVLAAEKEKIKKQLSQTEDKYKRSLAEMENVRQRMQKQVSDAKLFGIQGFCKDLLEVADILGKATEAVPKAELNKDNQVLKDLFDGLSMTETQLQKVFSRHGLKQIVPAEGDTFDPNIHEALFQLPVVEGRNAGTVGTITKLGYKLHDRTIRPALVGVYK